jgi:hypothetical protein
MKTLRADADDEAVRRAAHEEWLARRVTAPMLPAGDLASMRAPICTT